MTLGRVSAYKTLEAGQSRKMSLYEVPWDVSLPGLGIGIIIEYFQMAGIRLVDTASLKRAVARCLETIDVCILRMFDLKSVVVTVRVSVGMLVV